MENKAHQQQIKKFQGDLLGSCRLDHRKFEDMHQSLSGKTIIEKLSVEFEIIETFKAICAQFPTISYVDHVELRVLAK